jgi:protein-(glutamine-N5) methyltransferase, release factor-specific
VTLREWLRQSESRLQSGPHPQRARLDTEALLLHLVGKNRAWLLTHLEDEFGGCKSIGYAQLIERRLAGEPIQYITGECEFYGLPFHVNRNVLVPRPETEHLVEKVLQLAARFERPRIVDVGTGSGAIPIALAVNCPDAQLTAVDIFQAALDVATTNAKANGLDRRIRFLHGDLLSPVTCEEFDIIVSNPPYIPDSDRNSLAVEVRNYEPAQALFAGAAGLDVYQRLIPQARRVLRTGGHLAMEIGFGQAASVATLLRDAGFSVIESIRDLQGIERVIVATVS